MANHHARVLLKRSIIFLFVVIMAYFVSNAFPWFLVLSSVSWNLASL